MISDKSIIKKFLPNLELKESFITTPDYLNYINNCINKAIDQADKLLLSGNSYLSPIYKIKDIFNNKPLNLNDIKLIEDEVNKIRTFKNNGQQ